MNLLHDAGTLAGGIGLFLLGMTMMTDGLKVAAGPALERILARATRTRWQALSSGILVTALVQSSTAVTVASIGFVNAGLMGLGGALWVLFGANVGTTMTGWIVALVGMKFKVEALALPLIGVGVVLKLVGGRQPRRGGLGEALAGFGLLFLGIALLQQAFTGLAAQVQLPQGTGPLAVLAQLGAGLLLTVLMQSSSASLTVALAAAQGGLLSAQGAAAVVIGANIGTTLTAILAAVGATANARRAATAHVVFNLLTGLVALALLPWLIGALAQLREALDLPPDPAAKLALFHTVFNLMGVLLMWPLAGALTRWLEGLFRSPEEDEARPRHLDDNVLAVPILAVDALGREVARHGAIARRLVGSALADAPAERIASDHAVAKRLEAAIDAFVERMTRNTMSADTSARLAQQLRRLRYQETAADLALAAAQAWPPLAPGLGGWPEAQAFRQAGEALLAELARQADPSGSTSGRHEAVQGPAELLQPMQQDYQALKQAILTAIASGRWPVAAMDDALAWASAMRRALEQSAKAGATGGRQATGKRPV